MRSELYNNRPHRIVSRLEWLLKPLGFMLAYDANNNLFSVKKGQKSMPCPYFFKDTKGRINMKIKTKEGDNIIKCIDKDTDEWLAYYAYKEITK